MVDVLGNMFSALPDVYNTKPGTNTRKILQLLSGPIQELQDAIEAVRLSRDVDSAFGKSLDRIGVNVQQRRGAVSDGVYRILIKSKILRNLSQGDIDSLINALSISLGCLPSDLYVTELWSGLSQEPAALSVSVKSSVLNNTGFSYTQFGSLVNYIVAGGVRANVLFKGTFAFSTNPTVPEIVPGEGFDSGMFGAYYDPVTSPPLPL